MRRDLAILVFCVALGGACGGIADFDAERGAWAWFTVAVVCFFGNLVLSAFWGSRLGRRFARRAALREIEAMWDTPGCGDAMHWHPDFFLDRPFDASDGREEC